MINKLKNSLDKALIQQGWHLGDVAGRIGHPFTWQTQSKTFDYFFRSNQRINALLLYVLCIKNTQFHKNKQNKFVQKKLKRY